MLDLQKEKNIIISDTNIILKDLHKRFPWVVVEIALAMQDKFGEENSFVKAIFENVLNDTSKEILEEFLPECLPHDEATSNVTNDIYNSFKVANLGNVLSKPLFSLDIDIKEECLPWDYEETNAATDFYASASQSQQNKIALIKKIKMDIKDLLYRKANLEKHSYECTEDCTELLEAIAIVVAILNYND